jgi:hypothetical protein
MRTRSLAAMLGDAQRSRAQQPHAVAPTPTRRARGVGAPRTAAAQLRSLSAPCLLLLLLLLLPPAVAPAPPVVKHEDMVARVAWAATQGPTPQPPFKLAICAVFYNEGTFLLEWIYYHYLVGVQHFYLYDNDSTDGAEALLKPLVARGLVTYIPLPGGKGATQFEQLAHCFNASAPAKTAWMAGIDIDEFIVVLSQPLNDAPLMQHDSFVLHDLLKRFQAEQEGAVMMDRMHFGCSGHAERPADLSIRAYTKRLINLSPVRTMGKPVVFMPALTSVTGAHVVDVKPPYKVVTANHEAWSHDTLHHTYEPFRLNHYVSRSFKECVDKSTDPRRDASTWRRQLGRQHCEKMMEGMPSHYREEHAVDNTLSASWYPEVLDAILAGPKKKRGA